MDKYSKILVIENGNKILNLIRDNDFNNSSSISPEILRDEIIAIDYITQFTPDIIIVSNIDREKLSYIKTSAEIINAILIDGEESNIIERLE